MTIAIINTKGGVGKTATTVHLGAALASRGLQTLLIDVDPAHGLTNYFDLAPKGLTVADVLLGAPMLDAIEPVRDNLFLCPASASLEEADIKLTKSSGPEVRLARALKKLHGDRHFDFILVDCPGAWITVSRNAVFACDAAILPVNCEAAAMVNAVDTIEKVRELADLHGREVAAWPLLTCFRAHNVARLVEELSREQWGDDLLSTRIRRAEKINESGVKRETLSDLSPGAAGGVGADYTELAGEIIRRAAK